MELFELFRKAEAFVMKNFPEDVEWSKQTSTLSLSDITKQRFYREYCFGVWVAGFRYSVVKSKWQKFTEAYYYFDIDQVIRNCYWVKEDCMKLIANERKIDATIKCATILKDIKFWQMWLEEVKKNIDKLEELPYVGPVTKYQLARNIGISTIKPDVHIVRVAKYFKMGPFEMCQKIADETGDSLHLIDTIIWRACEQRFIRFKS